MAVLSIDGIPMPSPSRLTVCVFQVSSHMDRSADGTTLIDRIAVKRRLECEWARLTSAQAAALLAALRFGADSPTPFFTAAYYDPVGNANTTVTAYAGDVSLGVYRVENGVPLYTGTKLSIIEQ